MPTIIDFKLENIENILESSKILNRHIAELSKYFLDKQKSFKKLLHNTAAKKEDDIKRLQSIGESLEHQQNKLKEKTAELNEIIFNQKVVKKKLETLKSAIDELNSETENLEAKREDLKLELIDLQDERKKRVELKKKEWNALKKSASVYRDNLNIDMKVNTVEGHDVIRIKFFVKEFPDKDKYFMEITNYDDKRWRVDNIKPNIDKHLKKINLDFSQDYELKDIQNFIIQVRQRFLHDKDMI